MKLVDLQRIAPNGGRMFISFAAQGREEMRWQEVEEIPFTARDLAEVVARLYRLRNGGAHLHWRVTIHPIGPVDAFPTTTRDFAPLKETLSPLAVDVVAPEQDPIPGRYDFTYQGRRYELDLGPAALNLFVSVVAAIASNSAHVPAEPVVATIPEILEAMHCAILAAKVHGQDNHPVDGTPGAIPACGRFTRPIRYLSAMLIQACDQADIY